jgi:hypothetical protein
MTEFLELRHVNVASIAGFLDGKVSQNGRSERGSIDGLSFGF